MNCRGCDPGIVGEDARVPEEFLHVLLAIAAVGANIIYGIWTSRAAREPRALAFALVLYAGVVVVGLAEYTPTLRRQIAALDANGPESPVYRRLAARGTVLGIVLAVLVVLIVFLTVTKPALWG